MIPPHRSDAQLARRVQVVSYLQLVAANLFGGVLMFVYFTFMVPAAPEVREIPIDDRLLSFILFVAFTLAVAPVALVRTWRHFGSVRSWLREGRDPSVDEREAALSTPWRLARFFFRVWVLAGVLFGGLNVYFEPSGRMGVRVFVGVLLGGLITAALGFLLVERTMRPVATRALAGAKLKRPRRIGVRSRLLVMWLLGSGIPLLAIAATPLLGGEGAASVTGTVWFLGLGGFVAGLAIIAAASRAIAEPVDEVRHAMERVKLGDVDVEVSVHDPGEIGLLQSGFNQMVEGLRERRRLQDLFGRHVGEEVARRALEGGVELGGERREASVLFVDVTGSTELAETRSPDEVVSLLNAFFDAVVRAVAREDGWVNKFTGDGALCIFGVPDGRGDHQARALRAARALRGHLQVLAERYPGLDAGIGVSSGEVVAGNVGAPDRYEYTVIGDPVNEAARLMDEAKHRPGRLLVSARTVEAAGAAGNGWRRVGVVELRGRRAPAEVWEPADLQAG